MNHIIKPSKDEISTIISKIESLNLKVVTIEEIKDSIGDIMKGCPINAPIFFPGISLYRGIKYETRPDHIGFLTYPKKQFAKQNRASREGESMFYCSTLRDVPFYELNVKVGDRLVLSRWKLMKNLLVNHVGYTKSMFDKLESNRQIPDWAVNDKGNKSIEYSNNFFNENNLRVRDFLTRTFCQEISENDYDLYKLTIAIAEKLYLDKISDERNIIKTERLDGIIYPTIRMLANADNLAISPSFIDDGGIEFMTVEYIEVVSKENMEYKFSVISEANTIAKNGNIEWKERVHWSKQVKFEDLTFDLEDGKWVARDDNGNIVEPD